MLIITFLQACHRITSSLQQDTDRPLHDGLLALQDLRQDVRQRLNFGGTLGLPKSVRPGSLCSMHMLASDTTSCPFSAFPALNQALLPMRLLHSMLIPCRLRMSAAS